LVAKQPSPPRAVVISHITAALVAIIKKKFQDPVRKEKPLIGDKPAVVHFKMTVWKYLQNKTYRIPILMGFSKLKKWFKSIQG
jgi:hypothetical protein